MSIWRCVRFESLLSPAVVVLLIFGLVSCLLVNFELATSAADNATQITAPASSLRADPHRVMGVSKADCKKCHPSEVAAWMKTVHYQTAEKRLFKFEGNTKKYADALGIGEAELLRDSLCADCHGTKAVSESGVTVIAGVSCESCHGASGGEDGWLNPHQSYHETMPIPRTQETAEHRRKRIEYCEQAGKIHSHNIVGLAQKCCSCHMIDNEKLIAAGHKAASTFEFVSWSSGEVRHNFLLNKDVNEEAPSLWMETTGGTAANRRRVKFVTGALVQLEVVLRRRAAASSPLVIPQYGGIAAAANGKLAQVNALAATEETVAAAAVFTPLLATLFVPQPNDAETYTQAADRIATQAKLFVEKHDGSQLQAIDSLIQAHPAHYSQQFKEKYSGG
jgi:hypothetical protein